MPKYSHTRSGQTASAVALAGILVALLRGDRVRKLPLVGLRE